MIGFEKLFIRRHLHREDFALCSDDPRSQCDQIGRNFAIWDKKLLKVNTHWAKMGENSSNLATLPNKHDFGEK
jgi:hypothetical protein